MPVRGPGSGVQPRIPQEFGTLQWLLSPSTVKTDKSNDKHTRYYNLVHHLAPKTMLHLVLKGGTPRTDYWRRALLENLGHAGGEILAPLELPVSAKSLCPNATPGCFGKEGENCIAGTGQLKLPAGMLAMLRRTLFFLADPALYIERIHAELDHYMRSIERVRRDEGAPWRTLAVRLNGTSDVAWEKVAPRIFSTWDRLQFYDYTKVPGRFARSYGMPENYHLTFSRSEKNDADAARIARAGHNVAVVFWPRPGRGEPGGRNYREAEDLPRHYFGRRVYDGDKHDLRFDDPEGVVVGLRAKGKLEGSPTAHVTPFVIYQDDPGLGEAAAVTLTRREIQLELGKPAVRLGKEWREGCARGQPDIATTAPQEDEWDDDNDAAPHRRGPRLR